MSRARACCVVLAGLLTGCGEDGASQSTIEVVAPPERPVEEEEPAIEGRLFGLETREHRLWIQRTDEGKRYTVTTKEDRVVARGIDDAALGRDFPELHELVHSGVDAVYR